MTNINIVDSCSSEMDDGCIVLRICRLTCPFDWLDVNSSSAEKSNAQPTAHTDMCDTTGENCLLQLVPRTICYAPAVRQEHLLYISLPAVRRASCQGSQFIPTRVLFLQILFCPRLMQTWPTDSHYHRGGTVQPTLSCGRQCNVTIVFPDLHNLMEWVGELK